MDISERVINNKLEGHCCSESIMKMSLEDMGWDEEDRKALVKSMGAFCSGLHEELTCGALCAAKAVLFLAEEERDNAKDVSGPELMAWFKERFGTWTCADILEGDVSRKQTLCPSLIADTYIKLRDMLEDIGAV